MAQHQTAAFELSTDGGQTFRVMQGGISLKEAGRGMARVRNNRITVPADNDDDSYVLHEVGTTTAWRWRAEELATAG